MSNALIPQIRPAGGQPLDAHQRKFNRLLAQLDKMRAELADWEAESARFGGAYDELVRPVLAELRGHRADAARQLDALLGQKGWTRREGLLLRELVCEAAAGLVDDPGLNEAEQAAFKALHDKHADIDFDTENREAMAGMKGLFEAMTGLDLGDEEIDSEEDLLFRARQRVHEQMQAAQAESDGPVPGPKRRKPNKAATARAQREQDAAAAASQTLREVYRKLATALHPDRATDEADRVVRTGRMQRVNQAYEAGDLLALLALQLEIEQVDAAHVARITSERAHQLNRLLAEQLDELKAEIASRHLAFCDGYGIDPRQPLGAKKLGRLLHDELAGARAVLAMLRLDLKSMRGERTAVKRWLKQVHQRLDDEQLRGFYL
ncbi:MAG: J domain-containing protein [Vitreoscilla sp.]|nr:J domain-containing protein [Vitreoscilla sp.]